MQITIHSWENKLLLKKGIFIYAGIVPCDLGIVQHNMRYGSGDYEDPPEYRDDEEGEFYYVLLGSTTERGKLSSCSGAHSSLAKAIAWAEQAFPGKVRWEI